MKYKIIEFNKERKEFKARKENGETIHVDPFVSCAFDGNPEDLIGKTFETLVEFYFQPILLPSEGDFVEVLN